MSDLATVILNEVKDRIAKEIGPDDVQGASDMYGDITTNLFVVGLAVFGTGWALGVIADGIHMGADVKGKMREKKGEV